MDRFVLIPLVDALPTVEDCLEACDESQPPDDRERFELTRVALRFLKVQRLLVLYARTLAGKPNQN